MFLLYNKFNLPCSKQGGKEEGLISYW